MPENRPHMRPLATTLSVGTLIALAACARHSQPAVRDAATAAATVNATTITTDIPGVTPQAAAKNPYDRPGIHNVHPISDTVISGGVPEGDEGFDELRRMGIRTIISVDGATPDVRRAEARGMRYVHIPITYAEVTPDQTAEIARAIRDLPGPVFVHCHHGKHRGPAAVASAMAALGIISPETGVAFMKLAGTAPTYEGLYACAAAAMPMSKDALDAAPSEFPSVRAPKGIVAAMVEIDEVFESLKLIRETGWKVPKDHPDLVPASLAGRLPDLLRQSAEDAKVQAWGTAYQKFAADSVSRATTLEEAIAARADSAALEPLWARVAASCKECHAKYRDKVQ